MLCVFMKILSHHSAKRKRKRLNDFKFRTFLVVFKQHHGSERVINNNCGRIQVSTVSWMSLPMVYVMWALFHHCFIIVDGPV